MDHRVGSYRQQAREEALGDEVLGVLDELLVGGGVLLLRLGLGGGEAGGGFGGKRKVSLVVVVVFEGKRRKKRKKEISKKPSFLSYLLRQKVHGRGPEDRGELQARDDVDQVDVVPGPVGGGRKGRRRKKGRRVEFEVVEVVEVVEVEVEKGMRTISHSLFLSLSLFLFLFLSPLLSLVEVVQGPHERLLGLGRVVDRDEDRAGRRGGCCHSGSSGFFSSLERIERASESSEEWFFSFPERKTEKAFFSHFSFFFLTFSLPIGLVFSPSLLPSLSVPTLRGQCAKNS